MSEPRFAVCVYCGSRDGARPAYRQAAEALGSGLAGQGWQLVYGAGDVGLMGRVARAFQIAGGSALGVIPEHLLAVEAGKRDLTRFIVTETMHERKKVMFMNANAIVVLPGGAGTLDELFEVLTWRQLGLHRKPIVLLDAEGYWQPFIALVEQVVAEGFAGPGLRDHMTVAPDVDTAIAALRKTASA